MGVPETCSRLKNGQRVRVDGTQGKVYLAVGPLSQLIDPGRNLENIAEK